MCETMQSSHRLRPAMALVRALLSPTTSGDGASVHHCRLRLTFPDHVQKRLDEFPKIGHFYTFLWGGPQVEGTRKSRWSRVGTSKIIS